MEIKNYMEDAVKQRIKAVLKQYPSCCTCDKCLQDILCLALNHLPARYISTEKGNLFARLEALSLSYEPRIIEALVKAIEVVSHHPRHGASVQAKGK